MSIDNTFVPLHSLFIFKHKMQLSLSLEEHKSISFQSSPLPWAKASFVPLVHWVYGILGNYCINQGPVRWQKPRQFLEQKF